MDEEFTGVPGVGEADNQGQAEDNGVQPETPRQDEVIDLRTLGIDDLDKTIQGRNQKSTWQKQVQAANRRAEQAERQAMQVAGEVAQLRKVISETNPELGETLVSTAEKAELAQLRAERQQREAYQEWVDQATRYHEDIATRLGVDVSDPEFQEGLQRMAETGDQMHVEKAQISILGRNKPAPQPQQPPRREGTGPTLPPGGGARAPQPKQEDIDRINERLDTLRKDYSKNKPEIDRLKKQRQDILGR